MIGKIMRHTFGLFVVSLALLSACASPPSRITPMAVPQSNYVNYSCSELAQELGTVSALLDEAEQRQRNAVAGDAIGVFLVLIPISAMAGDSEAEVARYKGEKIAIEQSLRQRSC
jgi:hypothetical protein